MWKVAREVGRSAEQRWWWNGCMRAAQQGEGGTMDIVADVPERRVVTGVVACDLVAFFRTERVWSAPVGLVGVRIR